MGLNVIQRVLFERLIKGRKMTRLEMCTGKNSAIQHNYFPFILFMMNRPEVGLHNPIHAYVFLVGLDTTRSKVHGINTVTDPIQVH